MDAARVVCVREGFLERNVFKDRTDIRLLRRGKHVKSGLISILPESCVSKKVVLKQHVQRPDYIKDRIILVIPNSCVSSVSTCYFEKKYFGRDRTV